MCFWRCDVCRRESVMMCEDTRRRDPQAQKAFPRLFPIHMHPKLTPSENFPRMRLAHGRQRCCKSGLAVRFGFAGILFRLKWSPAPKLSSCDFRKLYRKTIVSSPKCSHLKSPGLEGILTNSANKSSATPHAIASESSTTIPSSSTT